MPTEEPPGSCDHHHPQPQSCHSSTSCRTEGCSSSEGRSSLAFVLGTPQVTPALLVPGVNVVAQTCISRIIQSRSLTGDGTFPHGVLYHTRMSSSIPPPKIPHNIHYYLRMVFTLSLSWFLIKQMQMSNGWRQEDRLTIRNTCPGPEWASLRSIDHLFAQFFISK